MSIKIKQEDSDFYKSRWIVDNLIIFSYFLYKNKHINYISIHLELLKTEAEAIGFWYSGFKEIKFLIRKWFLYIHDKVKHKACFVFEIKMWKEPDFN